MTSHNRQEFEAWLWEEQLLDDEWDENRNCYKHFACHLAWRAWKAAKRQQSEESTKLLNQVLPLVQDACQMSHHQKQQAHFYRLLVEINALLSNEIDSSL